MIIYAQIPHEVSLAACGKAFPLQWLSIQNLTDAVCVQNLCTNIQDPQVERKTWDLIQWVTKNANDIKQTHSGLHNILGSDKQAMLGLASKVLLVLPIQKHDGMTCLSTAVRKANERGRTSFTAPLFFPKGPSRTTPTQFPGANSVSPAKPTLSVAAFQNLISELQGMCSQDTFPSNVCEFNVNWIRSPTCGNTSTAVQGDRKNCCWQ